MGNKFYELLGRATWAVGKRKVRKALTPSSGHRKVAGAITVLVVGAIVAGGVIARSSATST